MELKFKEGTTNMQKVGWFIDNLHDKFKHMDYDNVNKDNELTNKLIGEIVNCHKRIDELTENVL